ncbi:MAG: biotin-dependent carboxyltransferase family protein [Janthinobacterium lividum]
MSLEIIRPGLLTTVQDLGRFGYQSAGVVVSGALDAVALRQANLLVGNAQHAAGLEITLLGPRIRFAAAHLIALAGADLAATLNGQPVGLNRPVGVGAGAELAFGRPVAGSRAYLAVAGGVAVAPVLGSRATYLRAGLGGLHGRSLRAGDQLPVGEPSLAGEKIRQAIGAHKQSAATWVQATWAAGWWPYPAHRPHYLRAMPGPEYEQFSASSQRAFWEETFCVSPQADRMGYRLLGPDLQRTTSAELLSSAVTAGTVQVPAGGQAIVLLADCQTTGGYPRLAQVITADLGALAQLRPGQQFQFAAVTLAQAQALYLAQERRLRALQRAIELKIR